MYIPNTDIGRMSARRLRGARRKMWFWCGGSAIAVLCVVGILYGTIYGSWFQVKVRVEGMPRAETRTFLTSLYARIFAQKNIFSFLGPDHILFWTRNNLAEGNTASLLTPRISTDIFARTVTVDIATPTVSGVWCQKTECYGFNREGKLLTTTPYIKGSLLLRVDDESRRTLQEGYPILPRTQWIGVFMDTLREILGAGMIVESVRVRDFSFREWEVVTFRGDTFLFSFDFVPEGLTALITRTLTDSDMREARVFDFRVPHRIYYH